MSLVMMCNVFFVDCQLSFADKTNSQELCIEKLFLGLCDKLSKDNVKSTIDELLKKNEDELHKKWTTIYNTNLNQSMLTYNEFIASYNDYCAGWLNKLSEYVEALQRMDNVSYLDAAVVISSINAYYDSISNNHYFNNLYNETYSIQYECNDNKCVLNNKEIYDNTKLQEAMEALRTQINQKYEACNGLNVLKKETASLETSEECISFCNDNMQTNYKYPKALSGISDISPQDVKEADELINAYNYNDIFDSDFLSDLSNTQEDTRDSNNASHATNFNLNNIIINTIINTNIHNKLPTQHYNNSDPAKIHTVRTILQGVTGIDYKEALGGSGSGSSSSTTTTDTKLHEAYLIPTIQSISSYYANKEISTNHINSKEEEDNVISIDSSDELNDNDNDTDTINKTDKITDIANNDINSEISLSKILLQILSKHCGKSINIENFDDIISSLSKEDIENIILELKKLKNRMKNNDKEIDDIISAFQNILISTNHINTTDNSNIANNTDTINDIDITNTNTTNDDLNTENILIDILFKTLSKHFDKTVNIDNFDDTMSSLSKEDIENIILELNNLKKEMKNNEKEINILINAFQRYM